MAEITLRDYLKRIDDFIKENRLEEATAHSAHILQRYPKNALAYRALGRALMMLKRYEESGEIYRRLLTAMPDDFAAHYQLSFIHDELKQGNEALWHIERAFDQQSGNPTVNDRLRSLYKKYRNLDVDKIQLTAGAVANQYIAAGMFTQAIEILQRTLLKMPDRADLRLKLARAQWQAGMRIDAAESALEVLKTFPYALDANRILTELWLEEDRPSDAQRYLSRIEDVDPYQAMQIATGKAVSADTFMMEELDYKRYAAAMTGSNAPDWLDSLNVDTAAPAASAPAQKPAEPAIEANDDDWLADFADEAEPPAAPKKVTDSLSNLLPDDFDYPDSAGKDDTVKVNDLPQPTTGEPDDIDDLLGIDASDSTSLAGLLGDDDDWMDELEDDNSGKVEPATTGNLTGMLAKLGGNETQEQDDDDDWLRELASANVVSGTLDDSALDNLLDDDLFADESDEAEGTGLEWLNEDSPATVATDSTDDDPMAWLNEAGVEIDADDTPAATDEVDDALAWMQESGIEFDETASNPVPTLFDENDPVTLQSAPKNPMAWLDDDEIEFDPEDYEAEDTSNLSYYEQSQTVDDEEIADPMAWLADADAELADEDIFAPEPESSTPDPGMDWLSDDSVLDEMLDLHDLTEGDDFAVGAAQPAAGVDLSDLEMEDNFIDDTDWQDDMTDQPDWDNEDFADDDDSLEDLDWLTDDDLLEEDELPAAELADDDALAWMHQADTEPERETVADSDTDDPMAWLTGADAVDDEPADESENMGDPMAWLSESGIDLDEEAEPADEMDWMGELEAEADSDLDELLADESDFDYEDATDVPPEPAKSSLLAFLDTDSNTTADTSDWDVDIEVDDAFAEGEADWLAAIGGTDTDDEDELEQDTEAETISEADIDWMSELNDNEQEFDEEPIADGDMDWMSELGDDEEYEEEPIAEAADADWLSELSDDEYEEEPIAEGEADWLSELDDEETFEEEPAPAEIPDWMSELGDDEEYEEEPIAEAAGADWLSELSDDEEYEEEPIAEESHDWMSELSDDEEVEYEETPEYEAEEPVAETIDDGNWLSETDEDEAELEADDWGMDFEDEEEPEYSATSGMTGLLNSIRQDRGTDELEAQFDAALTEDEPAAEAATDWGMEFGDEDEYVSESVADFSDENVFDNEPDWLGALDSQEATKVPEEEPVAEPALDWGIEDEEAEPVEAIPLAETDNRGDLEAFEATFDDEAEPEFAAETEEASADYDEELEFASAENAPDWLNAMVPGLDLDYEAPEDEPVDAGFTEGQTHRQRALAEEVAATTSDFTWLQAIVDEETGIKPSEDDEDMAEPVARPSIRRFIFSKLPAWMRGGTSTPAATVEETVADVGVPDYLADFDDFDTTSDELDDDFGTVDDFDNFDDFDDMESFDDLDNFDDLDDDFEFDDDFDKK